MEAKVTPPSPGKVLPPSSPEPHEHEEHLQKIRASIKARKRMPSKLVIGITVVLVLVLAYLFAGSEAIVRRGNLGIGDKIAAKTVNGYVTKATFDSVLAGLKHYGYKDKADTKTGLSSAKDGARRMLAAEGYLEHEAKKHNVSLGAGELAAKLKQRYGSKTSEQFYRQYKNPEQMRTYFELQAKTQLYEPLLQQYLLKGKLATVLTVPTGGFSTSELSLSPDKAKATIDIIKKDIQDNFRPALEHKAPVVAIQAAIKTKKVNTNGVITTPPATAHVDARFYPAAGTPDQKDVAKLVKNAITEASILNGLKVGDISPATQLSLGGLVVVRYDADLSTNPFQSWNDLVPAAVKHTKFY